MPARYPTPHDPNALDRDLDAQARGLLRNDTPNHWANNIHAISNLSYSQVLYSGTFDKLAEVKKKVVIARVEHILEVLKQRYLRKEPVEEMNILTNEFNLLPLRNHPILYVRTEEMWTKILELGQRARADGSATGPAVDELTDYLRAGLEIGDLVHGSDLEECYNRGEPYREPRDIARHLDNLDHDDVHAFLCAYETCFHP